jgi:hypothetical protein
VQPLEDHEDAISVLRVDPDPAVAEREQPERLVPADRDHDPRRLSAAELQRVAEQVLEHRDEQRQLGQDQRQVAGLDGGAGVLDLLGQVGPRLGQGRVAGHQGRLAVGAADPAVGEQVVDQRLHALGAVHGELDVLVGPGVELAGVTPLEQLGEARHLAQRLLQVVRSDVGELLELGV